MRNATSTFSSDGNTFAVGGIKERQVVIRVFETAKYSEVRTIESVEPHWLYGLQFSADGKVATAVNFPEDPTPLQVGKPATHFHTLPGQTLRLICPLLP